MEDAIATKATSALNARLGDADGKLKELGIKWGIEYGILRDALDEVRKERDRYREALERIDMAQDLGWEGLKNVARAALKNA